MAKFCDDVIITFLAKNDDVITIIEKKLFQQNNVVESYTLANFYCNTS